MTRLICPTRAHERRAIVSGAAWTILLVVMCTGLTLDLWSKAWSFRSVGHAPVVLDRELLVANPNYDPTRLHAPLKVLPADLLEFRLILNPGAVFGIGAHRRWFFIPFTIVAVISGLLVFGLGTTRVSRVPHIAIGLVLAGGLGNLYDRLAFGRVRDFIHFLPGRALPRGWTWPGTNNPEMFPWVFNVADVLLLVGMLMLLVHISRVDRRRKALREMDDARDAEAVPVEG